MKKFRYNLENILQVKLKLEDQAKIAYGNARLRLTTEEQKLEQLKASEASYENEMRSLRSSRLDIVKIKQCAEAIEIMKQSVKQQMVAVKNAEQRLEIARIRLNEAIVERKIQEKLKENAFADYMHEFETEEQKEIDELNSFHYSNPAPDEEDR